MGRDGTSRKTTDLTRVSIHAPAWGATRKSLQWATQQAFQFTRPRGARPHLQMCKLLWACFNSRARVGRDSWPRKLMVVKSVSIHAPAWGATRGKSRLQRGQLVSIHAPAWGATRIMSCLMISRRFQFTRPRGARHRRGLIDRHRRVSIHAPAWGATRALTAASSSLRMFQFTRPRGARHRRRKDIHRSHCFNSRARVGRDPSRGFPGPAR